MFLIVSTTIYFVQTKTTVLLFPKLGNYNLSSQTSNTFNSRFIPWEWGSWNGSLNDYQVMEHNLASTRVEVIPSKIQLTTLQGKNIENRLLNTIRNLKPHPHIAVISGTSYGI